VSALDMYANVKIFILELVYSRGNFQTCLSVALIFPALATLKEPVKEHRNAASHYTPCTEDSLVDLLISRKLVFVTLAGGLHPVTKCSETTQHELQFEQIHL